MSQRYPCTNSKTCRSTWHRTPECPNGPSDIAGKAAARPAVAAQPPSSVEVPRVRSNEDKARVIHALNDANVLRGEANRIEEPVVRWTITRYVADAVERLKDARFSTDPADESLDRRVAAINLEDASREAAQGKGTKDLSRRLKSLAESLRD